MSKVLFCVYSNIVWVEGKALDSFFEGFIRALVRNGNDVLLLYANDIFPDPFDNNCYKEIDTHTLCKVIKEFIPDFIIASNNHIPEFISQTLSCPIVVYCADSPSHWINKELIRKDPTRYRFIMPINETFSDYCISELGVDPSHIVAKGYFTDFSAEQRPYRNDVLFLGFIGWPDSDPQHTIFKCKDQQSLNTYIQDFETKLTNPSSCPLRYLHMKTFSMRIHILEALTDLRLKIHGIPKNIFQVAPYCMDILRCFDMETKYSIDHVAALYNESKVVLNMPNAQAPGLSWRVADVMATNGCLISHPQKDLERISPYVDIPTYTSPAECHDLCRKLLADEGWRRDITEGCRKAVEENNRFEHLFLQMQRALGTRLVRDESIGEGVLKEVVVPVIHPHVKAATHSLKRVIRRLKATSAYQKFRSSKIHTAYTRIRGVVQNHAHSNR